MTMADRSLVDVLVDALRYSPTPEESSAASSPPYRLPSYLIPHKERVLSELDAGLKGAPCTSRILAQVVPFSPDLARRSYGWHLWFDDAACWLVASRRLSVSDAHAIIAAVPSMNASGLRRQIVLTHLFDGEVDLAREEAERIGEMAWAAYRDIGSHHASQGNVAAFFAEWRNYAAGKDRHQIDRMRRELVTSVARKDGWKAAVDLTGDKRVGPNHRIDAFRPWAATGDIEGMLQAFTSGEAVGVLTELDELTVLVDALRVDPHRTEREHPRLPGLLDRIIAVDVTKDKETMRRRDGLLLELYPAYEEQATLARARAAVRTPRFRNELRYLARENREAAKASQEAVPPGPRQK
jgi:hypothetical protein